MKYSPFAGASRTDPTAYWSRAQEKSYGVHWASRLTSHSSGRLRRRLIPALGCFMNMWLRALLSSAIVSFVVAAGSVFFLAKTVSYSPPLDWSEINKLPYQQAQSLINSRSQEVHGLAPLLSNLHDPWFWQMFAIQWLLLAGPCFVSCCALLFWQSRATRKSVPAT